MSFCYDTSTEAWEPFIRELGLRATQTFSTIEVGFEVHSFFLHAFSERESVVATHNFPLTWWFTLCLYEEMSEIVGANRLLAILAG